MSLALMCIKRLTDKIWRFDAITGNAFVTVFTLMLGVGQSELEAADFLSLPTKLPSEHKLGIASIM